MFRLKLDARNNVSVFHHAGPEIVCHIALSAVAP
jgi:hypothetical protein